MRPKWDNLFWYQPPSNEGKEQMENNTTKGFLKVLQESDDRLTNEFLKQFFDLNVENIEFEYDVQVGLHDIPTTEHTVHLAGLSYEGENIAREASSLLDHAGAKYLAQSRPDTTAIANGVDNAGEAVLGRDFTEWVKPEFWQIYIRGHGSVRHLINSCATEAGSRLTERDRDALKAALRRNDKPVRSVHTKVYTIHASKGGEAKNVVVYDGITTRIDEAMGRTDEEYQNEYRTWYVALTRSSANLFVLRGGFEWIQDDGGVALNLT